MAEFLVICKGSTLNQPTFCILLFGRSPHCWFVQCLCCGNLRACGWLHWPSLRQFRHTIGTMCTYKIARCHRKWMQHIFSIAPLVQTGSCRCCQAMFRFRCCSQCHPNMNPYGSMDPSITLVGWIPCRELIMSLRSFQDYVGAWVAIGASIAWTWMGKNKACQLKYGT